MPCSPLSLLWFFAPLFRNQHCLPYFPTLTVFYKHNVMYFKILRLDSLYIQYREKKIIKLFWPTLKSASWSDKLWFFFFCIIYKGSWSEKFKYACLHLVRVIPSWFVWKSSVIYFFSNGAPTRMRLWTHASVKKKKK